MLAETLERIKGGGCGTKPARRRTEGRGQKGNFKARNAVSRGCLTRRRRKKGSSGDRHDQTVNLRHQGCSRTSQSEDHLGDEILVHHVRTRTGSSST